MKRAWKIQKCFKCWYIVSSRSFLIACLLVVPGSCSMIMKAQCHLVMASFWAFYTALFESMYFYTIVENPQINQSWLDSGTNMCYYYNFDCTIFLSVLKCRIMSCYLTKLMNTLQENLRQWYICTSVTRKKNAPL